MTMTVKKLISEFEKIDNKFLEVEIEVYDKPTILPAISSIIKVGTKIIIRLERSYGKYLK